MSKLKTVAALYEYSELAGWWQIVSLHPTMRQADNQRDLLDPKGIAEYRIVKCDIDKVKFSIKDGLRNA